MDDVKMLTASSNTGIGLWTSICVAFCSIFGIESQNYKAKQEKILATANDELKKQFDELGSEYDLVDYRVTWSGKLAVTVSALAVKKNKEKEDYNGNKTINGSNLNKARLATMRQSLNDLYKGKSSEKVIEELNATCDPILMEFSDTLSKESTENNCITVAKDYIKRFISLNKE